MANIEAPGPSARLTAAMWRLIERISGGLRRRFAILLSLLAVLSFAPWAVSNTAGVRLDGIGRQLDLAGSLRYRLMRLALVPPEDISMVRDEQLRTLDSLLEGDPERGVPDCSGAGVCERLHAHRRRFVEELVPASRADGGAPLDLVMDELAAIDGTVHAMAAEAEATVAMIGVIGFAFTGFGALLVVLVGLGVWDVFSRIRRVEHAIRTESPEESLSRYSQGTDEVAALARSITASLSAQRLHEEMERREVSAKNAELVLLGAQKNRLLGMAAHDLRNPLGIVYGYSELLLADVDVLAPEEIAEMAEIIHRSSAFMRGLIDDLLDITSIEAGTLRLSVVPTDPIELARSNVALNAILAASKEIRIRLVHDTELPLVDVDPQRFDQVLNNLLSNAVKYSEPATTVTVSVRAAGASVSFAVSDDGRGIAPEFLETIFRPFAKEEATGTGGEKSTGLGLAIVKRIVEAHGGTVAVVSRLGEGSTFTVSLPVHRLG